MTCLEEQRALLLDVLEQAIVRDLVWRSFGQALKNVGAVTVEYIGKGVYQHTFTPWQVID